MQVVTALHGLNKWVLYAQASRKFTVGSVIQRDPAPEFRRKETAAQLLRLLSGRSLEDPTREKELLAALHFLPAPPAPPRWRALADSVQSVGPAAVQQKLSKTMYIVPDVECAAGLMHLNVIVFGQGRQIIIMPLQSTTAVLQHIQLQGGFCTHSSTNFWQMFLKAFQPAHNYPVCPRWS